MDYSLETRHTWSPLIKRSSGMLVTDDKRFGYSISNEMESSNLLRSTSRAEIQFIDRVMFVTQRIHELPSGEYDYELVGELEPSKRFVSTTYR